MDAGPRTKEEEKP